MTNAKVLSLTESMIEVLSVAADDLREYGHIKTNRDRIECNLTRMAETAQELLDND